MVIYTNTKKTSLVRFTRIVFIRRDMGYTLGGVQIAP